MICSRAVGEKRDDQRKQSEMQSQMCGGIHRMANPNGRSLKCSDMSVRKEVVCSAIGKVEKEGLHGNWSYQTACDVSVYAHIHSLTISRKARDWLSCDVRCNMCRITKLRCHSSGWPIVSLPSFRLAWSTGRDLRSDRPMQLNERELHAESQSVRCSF